MLTAIPEIDFREMGRTRNGSICCGVSAWLHCDAATKLLQVQRLREAESTGAKTMVVACPKCEIHFRCAMSGVNENFTIEIKGLTTIVAETMAKTTEKKERPEKATRKRTGAKPKKAKKAKGSRAKSSK
jgi:Fe-S oxidoreductase